MKIPAHIKALLLPVTVAGIIPAIILFLNTKTINAGWGLVSPYFYFIIALGVIIMLSGLSLLAYTIRQFRVTGEGTLAPWVPTRKMVIAGPYRYVRNPMITGVLAIIAGEAIVFGSFLLAIYLAFCFLLNHFYFILSEEPGLVKRFGQEYLDYKKNVPRWIPRLKPYKS